ncbi:acetyl-CoA carboxylase biotin carboxyl carrier protein [Rhodobacter sp. NTK016B]|uniref:acetyl-CoA carboxylase biotin carboxyl carrier protein n=1 Tax=Rhodobacter sp. NTK016B TaxID=2759676 RepID=UPI001A8DCB32|nr:acetyl-CoA carboxylase biotin carboxyl carrier protein [Rhodobacter sp. NTK016B]MBN8291519.1 acetyl-CoA carboxylase biotin carboxyl carrier protein [Rhodobacter sp. NTK016B]
MSKDHSTDDVAFIKALAELLNDNELSEISVKREYGENDTLNVKVSKISAMAAASAPVYAPAPQAPATPAASPAPAASAAPSKSSDPADHPGAVASPMVGTAYLAPEPGADAFVTVGQQVSAGETLLIIEAMKTMNHIPAPASGIVKRILVTDGTPVEYGAPLMIIE